MNFLVRFLTILGFVRGLMAAMVTEDRKIKFSYNQFGMIMSATQLQLYTTTCYMLIANERLTTIHR